MKIHGVVISLLCIVLVTAGTAVPAAASPARDAATSGGLSWGAPRSVDPPRGGLTSVSCVSTTWCRATGARGTMWSWDGTSWTAGQSFGDPQSTQLNGISCTSTTFCVASLGNAPGIKDAPTALLVLRDGTWVSYAGSAPDIDPNSFAGGDNSCVSPTFCMSVALAGYRRWNGSSWTSPVDVADGSFLVDVSCWSSDGCRAISAAGGIYRWDGHTWAGEASITRNGGTRGINCFSAQFCALVADNGRVAMYRDGAWQQPRHIASSSFTSVECPSASFCVALTRDGFSTVFHDSTDSWTDPVLVDLNAFLHGLSCPTVSFCVGASLQGNVLTRAIGGWSAPTVLDPLLGAFVNARNSAQRATAISCASATNCVLADASGATSTYDGTSWTAPTRVLTGLNGIIGISCPTKTFCSAVTTDGRVVMRRGERWSRPTRVFPDHGDAISCTSAMFCVASGGLDADGFYGQTSVWDGTVWQPATNLGDFTAAVTDISCVGTTCVAAEGFTAYVLADGSWTQTPPLHGQGALTTLSCTSATSCLGLLDYSGKTIRWNGRNWSDVSAGTSPPTTSISCDTATFCVAVGGLYAATWNGSSWSDQTPLLTPPFGARNQLTDVSCRAATCTAVDFYGLVVRTAAA